MNFRRGLMAATGAAVTAVCVYAVYKGLDDEAIHALRHASFAWISLGLALGSLSLMVRTQRWRALLLENAYLPFGQAFWTSAAGQMLNTFLPARMGDAFRGLAAATSSSRAYSVGVILVERVLDTSVVVLAALGALAFVPSVAWWMKPSVMLLSAAVVLAIAVLALLPMIERYLFRAVRRWRPSSEPFLADLIAGMRLSWKPSTVVRFVAWSILAWGLDAFGLTIIAKACGSSLSYGGGVLLVTALAFASAIPATGIVGVAPLACVFLLPSFGIGKGTALAIGIVMQSLNLVQTAVTGALGLWLLRYRTPAAPIALQRETA
jgi:uncharacterized membrane protein YbhN (UPF0104 family)